jgi:putative FmdB family regulatory protein
MPIYEYQCKACEHVFDVLQKMSDDPLTYCPECGEPQLRKLMSAPNFRLKGGGWYETDFKDKNKRNLAGGADAASADSSSKSDSKSDSKADSKPASKSSDSSSSTE